MAAVLIPPFKLSSSTTIVPRLTTITTLTGNSGGLTINGSSVTTDSLTLKPNSADTTGTLNLNGRLIIFSSQPTITASENTISYSPTYTFNAGATSSQNFLSWAPAVTVSNVSNVMSVVPLSFAGSITHTTSLAFIFQAYNFSTTITSTGSPGFAGSFTLFNGAPTIASSTAGVYPFPIVAMFGATPTFNAGNVNVSSGSPTFDEGGKHASVYNCTGASSQMTTSTRGWTDLVTLKANTAGSTLTCTARTGFLWKAVAFTATGSVVLTDNIGLDLEEQSASTGNFTSTNVYGIRSALSSGTNRYFINATGTAASRFGGIFSRYNGIDTVLCGIPYLVATVNLTTQAAAIATTTIYAVPATTTGVYKINWNAKVTRAATTSSTLGGLTITYTDPDGVVQTISAGGQLANGTIALTATTNNTTTVLLGYTITLNCKASTNIQYAFAYASSGATTMQYNINLNVENC